MSLGSPMICENLDLASMLQSDTAARVLREESYAMKRIPIVSSANLIDLNALSAQAQTVAPVHADPNRHRPMTMSSKPRT